MKKYSGVDYIRIDIANQYGFKGTFEAGIKWVKKQDLIGLRSITHRAKHPARMAAAIIALDEYYNKIPSGHLVGMDANASGAQMMAVLINCKRTAKNTGLVGKRKNDLYQNTADEMSKLLGEKLAVSRTRLKEAQMPYFYGSKRQPKIVFGDGTKELKAFYEVQEIVAPGAARLMQIFPTFWQPYADEHSWVMPDGFQVRKSVIQTVQELIHIPDLDEEVLFQTSEVKGKQKGISLGADICHSCDAYVMREVVKRAAFEVLVIHDEYLCHPNHMNKLRELYIEVMAEVAESNLLSSILSQISDQDIEIEMQDSCIASAIREGEYAIS